MASCWVIGRKTTLAGNGHEVLSQPFIVFETEDEADAACDMVERVSGERPMKAEAALYRCFVNPVP
ncbi:hypothetical protein [Pseudorhodoplanes sinuspersici]|uniref:Uncharacterized protein n=1 Tax=Pseudorhodoplanes sinuspersici TaxID=1235591 RepID=A0A1W6ZYQ3_9HYPH|nr:hypothetical protein [Pseudorhodoplanes sinuspersici]ARQ01865.1 hypothetical protein CAK95_24295 [Pseudorhodoplanes sinuspersici]RKE73629.1 hypothetical protein DFP91_1523 [Pseudorhodoplanes sinuspersici]